MQVFRLPWQHGTFVPECHFPSQLGFFFFRTLPDFKTLVAEATPPFKGKRLAVPIYADARALL